jgi:hypothetical protein
MTDEREPSGRTALDEPPWLRHVREAIDGRVLLDVRVAKLEDDGERGLDFLLVHPGGMRYEALDRFFDVMEGLAPEETPPFLTLSVEGERAHLPWYSHYASVKR